MGELFSDNPPVVASALSTDLQVHFIDVGQGDSTLVMLPNGPNMLIDGGSRAGSDKLVKYLWDLGVRKIDFLVATHPHEDHIGGLPAVIDSFSVGSVYMPRVGHNTKAFENLLLAIKNKKLTINTAKAGVKIITLPDLQADIIAPGSGSFDDLNDYSAVIKLTYKESTLLFTGDAEAIAEKQMSGNLRADVLKVGYHGSNTSTTQAFLGKVKPTIAVISCGKDNSYGHPHKEVLDRLKLAGAEIYRTDLDGTVVLEVRNSRFEVRNKSN
jgi:competence protein ComEC